MAMEMNVHNAIHHLNTRVHRGDIKEWEDDLGNVFVCLISFVFLSEGLLCVWDQ